VELGWERRTGMKGLLVRVGIDSTDGRCNAPMRLASGEFAYVTITDTKPMRKGLARRYNEFIPVVKRFGVELPSSLAGKNTHLDPDFDYLTYGDQGQRGKRIQSLLTGGDLLAFFAALRPMDGPARPLIYAVIGLFVVEEVVLAKSIPRSRWAENAHTRRVPGEGDIVVRAKPGVSGRLRRCIPIGELRDRVYRVRNDLLETWGGLDIKDGYIHRSVRLPAFQNAGKFYRWFLAQKPKLIQRNN
jgi:Nucleotide modification associated domain 3